MRAPRRVERAEAETVLGALEGDDARASGREQRHLDRPRVDVAHRVQQALGLLRHRVDDAGVRVSDGRNVTCLLYTSDAADEL